jgi:hypothetical protein
MLLKKTIIAVTILFLSGKCILSQNTGNPGKPVAEIFTDFHYSLKQDIKTTGFSVNRAYFGYNYIADGNFSANLKLNIGNPDDVTPDIESRRYAFFREGSITYAKDRLNLTFGMTTTRLYDFQQKFWNKRYVANTYQSINNYGFVADLGVVAEYRFSDLVEVDATLMNGEGYYKLQLDNSLKPSVGITVTPANGMAFRVYGDLMKVEGLWQTTFICFAGYKNDLVTVGGEFSYKSNLDKIKGHNAFGFSATGAVSLTKKIEFFTRFDYSTSVKGPGENVQWNIAKDGEFLITGFQYTFNKYVRIALDYQGTFPKALSGEFSDLLFINSVFKF